MLRADISSIVLLMSNLRAFRSTILILILPVIAWPQKAESALVIPGLSAAVTVKRDARSIPYIEAQNDHDLYFAQGFVTASDRLWQMDLLRRRARGETAEIFGSRALEDDKLWRRYGFARVAEENLKLLPPEMQRALESYSAGVNAFIATLTPETLPSEFRILQYSPAPWKPTDTITIGRVLAEALSSTWRQDLQRAAAASLPAEKVKELTSVVTPYDVVLFGKDRPEVGAATPGLPATTVSAELLRKADKLSELHDRSLAELGLYAEDLAASNNWVMSGRLTADGKPVLANDPHLAATAPGIWHMAHLTTPTARVAGVTIPGVPGIVLGHNEYFAWGATNVGPDVQDVYVETFDGEGRVKTPQGWEAAKRRTETIKVRKSLVKPDTDTVSFEVVETRHGPIILEEGGKSYALKWTAFDPQAGEFEAFFYLNRGRTWDDFKNALRSYGGATQNFIYADTKGNIGWYAAGRIPIRRTGSGALPYDGATNAGDWVGDIPFNELPNLYNPPGGLIVTANQRTVGTDYRYPQFARDVAMPWRARRIIERLDGKKGLTMDDSRDAQYDIFNLPFSMLAKQIVESNAASSETVAELKGWDGLTRADAKAPVIVNEIRNCMANRIADSNKPVPAAAIRERILYWAIEKKDAKWLPTGVASWSALIKACDETSRADLIKRLGADATKWRWDSIYRARFVHPLAAAPLIGGQFTVEPKGVNGSGQTPDVGVFVSMRHIASPGNWDATRFVIPLGQSGDNRSPHFRDQFELWNSGAPAVFPFSKSAVEASSKSITTFQPGK